MARNHTNKANQETPKMRRERQHKGLELAESLVENSAYILKRVKEDLAKGDNGLMDVYSQEFDLIGDNFKMVRLY